MALKKLVSLTAAAAVALSACAAPAEPKLAVLGQEPASLPAWVYDEYLHSLVDLSRVGTDGYVDVLASHDENGDWCIVMVLQEDIEGEYGAVAANCVSAELFASDGVRTSGANGERSGTAWILPDDFTGEVNGEWERITENLAVLKADR